MLSRYMGGLDVLPGGALVCIWQGGIDLGPDEAHLLGHVDQVINFIQDATSFLELIRSYAFIFA